MFVVAHPDKEKRQVNESACGLGSGFGFGFGFRVPGFGFRVSGFGFGLDLGLGLGLEWTLLRTDRHVAERELVLFLCVGFDHICKAK